MLYYLFNYLDREFDLIGAGVFQYISFRSGLAMALSLLITITFGKPLIEFLRKKQPGETIRDLGLKGQMEKKGTPTMGGFIIIGAILIPTILLARLDNIYIILLIILILCCFSNIFYFTNIRIPCFVNFPTTNTNNDTQRNPCEQ